MSWLDINWQTGGGQRAHFVYFVSQLPAAQSNFSVKMAYFGVAYSDPLHNQT